MGRMSDPLGIMISVQFDNKLDWLGLPYGLIYLIPVVACGIK